MCVHDTFAINSESAVNSNKKSAKCKVFLDFASFFAIIVLMFFSRVKEVDIDEDDLSTEKETEIKGTRISCKNAYCRRKKSFGCQKSKR